MRRASLATLAGISILAWREPQGQHFSLAFVEQTGFEAAEVRLRLRFTSAVDSIRVLPDEAEDCL